MTPLRKRGYVLMLALFVLVLVGVLAIILARSIVSELQRERFDRLELVAEQVFRSARDWTHLHRDDSLPQDLPIDGLLPANISGTALLTARIVETGGRVIECRIALRAGNASLNRHRSWALREAAPASRHPAARP